MLETTKPDLIDLVEFHINREFKHWHQGIGIYKITFGHLITIWGRDAGILLNNKWYGWTDIKQPLNPIHATDSRFFDIITRAIGDAFCRSGEDVRWNRALPVK